jgi:hypothetical protein
MEKQPGHDFVLFSYCLTSGNIYTILDELRNFNLWGSIGEPDCY